MTRPYPGVTGYGSFSVSRPRTAVAAHNGMLVFLVLHLPLAMIMKSSVFFATIHGLATFAIGLAVVIRSRTPERVLYVQGYIIAAEPLWRVSKALIFYESGKYAIAALSILALSRFRLWRRADKTALAYFLLLLPSLLVLPEIDRRQISFNLSGPFSLAMTTLFISALKLPSRVFARLFLTILAPIVSLAFVATFSTLAAESINFYSSKVAAGGVGKNQASSVLALGGFLAFLYLNIDRHNRLVRWVVIGVGIWCGAQAMLTFSRGGIATALGGIAAASFFLLRDRQTRSALMVRIGMLALLAGYVVIPQLDLFTGGALLDRFSSTHLTGRDKIIEADLMAFWENPVLGVGPGQSKAWHTMTFRMSSSHTEYSRLLAEHGLFGLAALTLLVWMALRRWRRPTSLIGKALAASFTVWALLFMFHAAMRMAASSFIFALGAAYLAAEAPTRAVVRRRTSPPTRRPVLRQPLSGRSNLAATRARRRKTALGLR